MLTNKELPPAVLGMMDPFNQSPHIDRLQLAHFRYWYGPEAWEFYQGLRDGQQSAADLPRYSQAIDAHFFETFQRMYDPPPGMSMQDLYEDLQEISLRVCNGLVEKCFPNLKDKLGSLKNEVLLKAPNPSTLFKILALPKDQVDITTLFTAKRQLVTSHSAAPLLIRSKKAEIGRRLAFWHDKFDEELFEPPYGAGEDYSLTVYHEDRTNRVIRFHPINKGLPPPRKGERLATHTFSARRIRGYGLAFVNVEEEPMEDQTIGVLTKAARNGGVIRPAEYIKGGMKMTFVDLEDNPKSCRGKSANTPHLTALKAKVMEMILRYTQVGNINSSSPDVLEISDQIFPTASIRLEFWNRREYLNSRFNTGFKAPVKGFPEPIFNGPAKELADLRDYYFLVPYYFPKQIFGIDDPQGALLRTVEDTAHRLVRKCTAEIIYLNSEDIQTMIAQPTT